MEIRCCTSSSELSNLTQTVEKGQDIDAFSELFAMLFANMLVPNSNQLMIMDQAIPGDLSNSSESTDVLSIVDNLRIPPGEIVDTNTLQSLINNSSSIKALLGDNMDLQGLFNQADDISTELREFMDSINALNSTDSSIVSNNSINIVSQELENSTNTTEVKGSKELFNIGTIENAKTPDTKITKDLQNAQAPAVEADKSKEEAVSDLLDIRVPGSEESASNAEIIDLENPQGTAAGKETEKSTNFTFELTNNLEQTASINNIKNENLDSVDLKENVTPSNLVQNPKDLIDITVEKFKTLRLPGSTEVTVKLKPDELGEVSLKLVLEKGQINGNITADRKEVVLMLQNSLEQLKTDLKNNNVNLNYLSVNIQPGEDFDRNNNQRGFNNKQNKNNHRIVKAFEEEVQSYDSQEGINIIV